VTGHRGDRGAPDRSNDAAGDQQAPRVDRDEPSPLIAGSEPGGESRYPARPAPDQPLTVHVEFVVLDGPAGQALGRNQARILRKVLQWIAEHPETANP
jgi:hypothetical protein